MWARLKWEMEAPIAISDFGFLETGNSVALVGGKCMESEIWICDRGGVELKSEMDAFHCHF